MCLCVCVTVHYLPSIFSCCSCWNFPLIYGCRSLCKSFVCISKCVCWPSLLDRCEVIKCWDPNREECCVTRCYCKPDGMYTVVCVCSLLMTSSRRWTYPSISKTETLKGRLTATWQVGVAHANQGDVWKCSRHTVWDPRSLIYNSIPDESC